jgi:branched-chain amino acid transport system substrate-binding protein
MTLRRHAGPARACEPAEAGVDAEPRSWRGRWWGIILTAGLLATVTACGDDGPPPIAAGLDPTEVAEVCEADPHGCVEFGVGAPVELGALLWVGPDANSTGVDSRIGVELAVDYLDGAFNDVPGELLGHPVVIDVEDDGCDREAATAAAQRLLDEPGLLAVVGTTCSSAALEGAAAVLSERGVLLVSPSATAPALTDPERRDRFFFRTAPNDQIQGAVVADFVTRTRTSAAGVVRVATVDDSSAYSSELARVFTQQVELAGGEVAATATLGGRGAGGTTVDTVVADLAAASPDVVFLTLFEPDCSAAVSAIRSVPALAGTTIVVAEACVVPEALAALGPAAVGVFGSAPDFTDTAADPFYAEEFVPAFRRRFGAPPPSVFHAHAFDAANLVFEATRRVALPLPGGAFAVPRSALRTALLDVANYRGVSGLIACRPSGDCAQSARFAIFPAPGWPVGTGAGTAEPVFSQSKSLREVLGGQ